MMIKLNPLESALNEADALREQVVALQSVSVKLRELVRDFDRYRDGDCQHCGYGEQCKARQTNCYKVRVNLHIRARELGIEVD